MNDSVKYTLNEPDIPTHWYNIVTDLPSPPPPVLHPGTKQPAGPDDLAPLFSRAVIAQEVSQTRNIEIPGPVRDGWSRRSTHRRESITSTRVPVPLELTNPIRRSPRRSTTARKACAASPPRPAPGSGARRWPSRVPSSAWKSKCSWSG